jgi:DNA-binding SARP family transcriptional activator/TolB-like protein
MDEALVQLRILGHTELSRPGGRTGSRVLRQPKRLALLSYLALATADGYRRRDQIVALFWPDLDQTHARTQLRKLVHTLRSVIGSDAFSTRGDEEIRLDPERVWCDAVAFTRSIKAREWAEALELYRGDLLEGLFPGGVGQEFETWLEDQRGVLREQASQAAWECSSSEDLAGRRQEALALARRAVELDADDEEGVRRLIAVLDRYGDRAGALRLYAEWQSRLMADYGAEPAPETRKLVRKVQAHRKGESDETPASSGSPVLMPTSIPAKREPHWWPVVAGATILLLIVGIALVRSSARRSTERTDLPAVAVLPFRGLGDLSDTRVGEGLAEELTTALSQVRGVAVRSTARSREALQGGADVGEVGRRLGVAYLMDGSVRHGARGLRVTARLVRVADAVTIWAQVIDAGQEDLIAAEEGIATVITDSLRSRLVQRVPHP